MQFTDGTRHNGMPSPAICLASSVTDLMSVDEVLRDVRLTQAEKREVLAEWASDRRAVPDAPTLRQLDCGAVVRVGDILRALKSLDADQDEGLAVSYPSRPVEGRLLRLQTRLKAVMRRGRSDDDDDDPPPCPVMVAGPLAGPLSGGEAVDPVLAVAA